MGSVRGRKARPTLALVPQSNLTTYLRAYLLDDHSIVMKAHFILLALCGLGLLTNAAEMMVEDEEDDGVFHHGFSMADEMDDEESGMMEDDEERMADPLRVRIRIRRPPPFGEFGEYAGLGGVAGLGGLGLSGGFGMGFDDNESHDEAIEDEDSTRSASDPAMDDDNTDDEERNANPLRVRIRVRPSFPSFEPRSEMKDMMHEIMADPQLGFRLGVRLGRRPFGFGWPFGFPFGFRRFGGSYFGRRSPLFFDDQHSDDDTETQPTNMENDITSYEEQTEADPLVEDIKIKERIRIRMPDYRYGRYGRYGGYPRMVIQPPRITLDETDSTTTKTDKLSPIELLARERARSALLVQRYGLLTPDSFWCRRSGSVDCRGRRRPFVMPRMKFCFYKRVCV